MQPVHPKLIPFIGSPTRSLRVPVLSLALLAVAGGAHAEWNPAAWQDESTLDFRTTNTEEGEHWSRVWLVVLDDQMYVRLGSRAADRITKNADAPLVTIRIAGQQFDRVRAEATPDKASAVAEAIGDKYWSDVLIRYFPHPLTMRLVAETPQ